MISSENRLPLFGIMLDHRPAKEALRFSRNALQPSWEVFGIEHEPDHALLVGQGGRKRHVGAVEQGALEQLEHERRLGGDLCGDGACFREHARGRNDLVGKADGDGLGGGNLLAGEHDLLGATERHLTDDALGATGAGKQPERDFRQTEPRGVGENADVGCENELGAAAERKAVDRRDGRLVGNLDAAEHAMHDLGEFAVVRKPVARIQIGDVAAGDEGALARAGDDDDTDIVIALDPVEDAFQLQQRRYVERIEDLRPVDGYHRNMVGHRFGNALFHLVLLSLACGCAKAMRAPLCDHAVARLTAATMRPASGRYQSSSDLANGGGMNGAPTRTSGPSSSSKPISASRATISAPTPNASTAS